MQIACAHDMVVHPDCNPITRETLGMNPLKNNNAKTDSVELEIKTSSDVETSHALSEDEAMPEGCKWMTCHCVCDAKFDEHLETGPVTGMHMTGQPIEDVSSGAAGAETVRLGFFSARLSNSMMHPWDAS